MPNNHGMPMVRGDLETSRSPSERPILHLTQAELDDLDLLCYTLGAARNACINFATKYICTLSLHSTLAVKLPQPQKPSKTNPPLTVDYRLNPEVLASVRAARAKRRDWQSAEEAEIAKPALLFLCKKLLPPKTRRIALTQAFKKGAS
jgi:hypothetical protein